MKMKRKGFTLVELLVVIAIIALLMGILMPALAKVRQIAYRMVCGTNLAGIGKAMLIYSNDYQEDYPVGGLKGNPWTIKGYIKSWKHASQPAAFGWPTSEATITSCLFLLVRYADVAPKQFVCKGDIGTRIFKISDGNPPVSSGATGSIVLEDVWDFGQASDDGDPQPGEFCTYSYQYPFNFPNPDPESDGETVNYRVTSVSTPGTPVCADRNPYVDRNAEGYIDGILSGGEELPPGWTTPPGARYDDPDKTGNAAAHQREGQNVLFNDSHVLFAKAPNVGIDSDNVYKIWPSNNPSDADKQGGMGSVYKDIGELLNGAAEYPMTAKDAYLIGETNRTGQ